MRFICPVMTASKSGSTLLAIVLACTGTVLAEDKLTTGEVLSAASKDDWRDVAPENLVIMQLGSAEIVIELAPQFAPEHVENLRTLIGAQYFDGLAVVRSQDNYVVQWGDRVGTPIDPEGEPRSLGDAREKVRGEFETRRQRLEFTELEAVDAYADTVGFVDGFPVAGDRRRAWLAHCYGMVGVGRGNAADSGNSSSLYVVTGHAPRHLDRNVTLIGRVLSGMETLASLPRGTGPLGFYESDAAATRIDAIVLASLLPEEGRPAWQRLRTDTDTFTSLVESRRTRHEPWFREKVGRIGLCNVPLPSRPAPPPKPKR